MNKETFENAMKAKELLEEEAMNVLHEIHDVACIHFIKSLEIESIDERLVSFKLEDGEGGFYFKTEYLYDKNELKKYLDDIVERKKQAKIEEESLHHRNRMLEEQSQYDEFLLLEERFRAKRENRTEDQFKKDQNRLHYLNRYGTK